MSCSSLDLKGYFLGEIAEADRRVMRDHLAGCQECREELERLRQTQAALLTLRDEEVPRRIAFVSDKVFEPRWWQVFWRSGARLGFASAAVLSAAILVHAFLRPPNQIVRAPADAAQIQAIVERELTGRLQAAVQKAVAEREVLQEKKSAELLAAAERRLEFEWKADRLAMASNFEALVKRMSVILTASADMGGSR